MRLVAVLVCLAAAFAAAGQHWDAYPLLDGVWPSTSGEKFSFVVLGDKTSGGEGKWPIFDRAIDTINLLNPDFVITVGDHIPGHMQERELWDAEWAEYLEHARRLKAPQFLTVGNHDIANVECYQFWKEDIGPTYYAFDYKDCHFLVLNTEEERFDGRGPIWNAMMTFAETDLAAHAQARHTFVFFHKPMWDDPRFEEDMRRLERALGTRPYTVIAGHEHYLMTERRNGRLYVLQNATGGGIDESDVREFGAFQGFGYVTVDGDEVTYAILEPDGTSWPVDIAPASFRKAIAHDVVRWDALAPPEITGDVAVLRTVLQLTNPFAEAIEIEVSVPSLDAFQWETDWADGLPWRREDGALVAQATLPASEGLSLPIDFRTTWEHLSYPPPYAFRVRYRDAWLRSESYPMVQENVIPAYPLKSWYAVPEWQVVGPFLLGEIDTSKLPDDPVAANPNFFRDYGPETGYDPERTYGDGLRWQTVANLGRGLLNFNGILGTQDFALGYALCTLDVPEDRTTHALMYSDNYSYMLLNGEVISLGQDFGVPGGFTYVPLQLRQGENTLLVKLINNRGDWFLRVLIADPTLPEAQN